ncbi:hypothetical protein CL657_01115 [bacterium]|nr:hypothetical protein [bacterium]
MIRINNVILILCCFLSISIVAEEPVNNFDKANTIIDFETSKAKTNVSVIQPDFHVSGQINSIVNQFYKLGAANYNSVVTNLQYDYNHISIQAEYDVSSYWVGSALELTPLITSISKSSSSLDLRSVIYKSKSQALIGSLKIAAVEYYTAGGLLSLGIQRLSFGLGKIWRPTDYLASYDGLNTFANDISGYAAIVYTHDMSSLSQWQLFIADNYSKTLYQGSYWRFNSHGIDYSGIILNHNKGIMVGGDIIKSFDKTPLTFYGEVALNQWYQKSGLGRRILIGMDRVINPLLMVSFEGFYNKNMTENATHNSYLFDYQSSFYLGTILQYQAFTLLSLTNTTIMNTADKSVLTIPLIRVSIRDNYDAMGGGFFGFGKHNTEFANFQNYIFCGLHYYY